MNKIVMIHTFPTIFKSARMKFVIQRADDTAREYIPGEAMRDDLHTVLMQLSGVSFQPAASGGYFAFLHWNDSGPVREFSELLIKENNHERHD